MQAPQSDIGNYLGMGGNLIGSLVGGYFGGPWGSMLAGMAGQKEGAKIGDIIAGERKPYDLLIPENPLDILKSFGSILTGGM